MSDREFSELLLRIRAGDADAAYELVTRYEPVIRAAVRIRLSDPSLRKHFDSQDICQSVLASFFFRAAAGQYELDDPNQLVALLTTMTQRKLAMHTRWQYRQRRDSKRTTSLDDATFIIRDRDAGPSRQLAGQELLQRAYDLMESDVRAIACMRLDGAEWTEIAVIFGGTAEAIRKRYQRGIDRVARWRLGQRCEGCGGRSLVGRASRQFYLQRASGVKREPTERIGRSCSTGACFYGGEDFRDGC